MDIVNQCKAFMRQAKYSKKLDFEMNMKSDLCRDLFQKVFFSIKQNDDLKDVKTLYLPTDDWSPDEDSILELITEMIYLKIAVLKGHRKGCRLKSGFRSLPCAFDNLINLFHLDISFNCLTILPEAIKSLKSLKILILNQNNLTEINVDIFPNSLEEFYCRHNCIEEVRGTFKEISRLKVLEFSSNKIKTIPESICFLQKLSFLGLNDNKLFHFPLNCLKCELLSKLDISHNQIGKKEY